MKRSTAKTLRALLLVCWTLIALALILAIQTMGETDAPRKTISSIAVAYACLSPAVTGIVFRLSKIIKG